MNTAETKRFAIWKDDACLSPLVCIVHAKDKQHARRIARQNSLATGPGYHATEMTDDMYLRSCHGAGFKEVPA